MDMAQLGEWCVDLMVRTPPKINQTTTADCSIGNVRTMRPTRQPQGHVSTLLCVPSFGTIIRNFRMSALLCAINDRCSTLDPGKTVHKLRANDKEEDIQVFRL